MLAFQAALDNGYGIELDVQVSKDGKAMVFHDDTLQRMTSFDGLIAEQTEELLTSLCLHDTYERIPTLEQVLALVDGKVPLLIDVKSWGKIGPLEDAVLKAFQGYQGDFSVQSFNPVSLFYFRRKAPWVLRGQLAEKHATDKYPEIYNWVLRNLLMNWVSQPDYIGYDVRIMPHPAVRRAQSRKLPVLAWTVDTEDRLQVAAQYADNIIFERISPGFFGEKQNTTENA